MNNRFLSLVTFLAPFIILASSAFAGHHESLMVPAKAGQVVVTYKGECPSESVDGAIAKIKEVILYEQANSPVQYASSPGVWADGKVGAVDVHDSKEAMDKAFAWQAADATWTASYDAVAASCAVTVVDFEVSVFEAR